MCEIQQPVLNTQQLKWPVLQFLLKIIDDLRKIQILSSSVPPFIKFKRPIIKELRSPRLRAYVPAEIGTALSFQLEWRLQYKGGE